MCSFQCTVGKRKHLWFLLRGPATYGSHLRRTSITLSTSPFTLIPASPPCRSLFVLRRKGERGGEAAQTKGKGKNCCLLAEGEEWRKWSDHCVMEGGKRQGTAASIRRRMQGEVCRFLRRKERATNRTNCVVYSPVAANRSPTVLRFNSTCEFSLLHTNTHKLLMRRHASCGS